MLVRQIEFNLLQETLSRSCRLPGLPTRHEQRSYSSLSRSQQRTVGAYNSKAAGTGGPTNMIPDSMDGSGNSEESSQKQVLSNQDQDIKTNSTFKEHTKEAKNNNDILATKNSLQLTSGHNKCENQRGRDHSIRKNQDTTWSKRTRYKNVHISNADASRKKWWRFLKWLPGLKDLKFPGRSTVTESHELGNTREELSMTMWNIRDDNEQRPAWISGFCNSRSSRRLISSSTRISRERRNVVNDQLNDGGKWRRNQLFNRGDNPKVQRGRDLWILLWRRLKRVRVTFDSWLIQELPLYMSNERRKYRHFSGRIHDTVSVIYFTRLSNEFRATYDLRMLASHVWQEPQIYNSRHRYSGYVRNISR